MIKLQMIQEYYGINFNLKALKGDEKLQQTYNAIDCVYNGIVLKENATVHMPANMFDHSLSISEPILFEEPIKRKTTNLWIHGIEFLAYRSTLLPGKYKFGRRKDETKLIYIPTCIEYRPVHTENETNVK